MGRGKRRSWAVYRGDRVQSVGFLVFPVSVRADEVDVDGTVEDDLGKSREGSRTDDEVVQRLVPEAPWFWKGQFEHQLCFRPQKQGRNAIQKRDPVS